MTNRTAMIRPELQGATALAAVRAMVVLLAAVTISSTERAAAQTETETELTAPVATTSPQAAVDEWFEFVGNLNSSTILEPAGSRGSAGLAVGAGASMHAVSKPLPITTAVLERTADNAEDPYLVPRAWLMKGLPWPVDVGLTVGAPQDRSFSQIAGIVQWTVFEALALPAVTVRAGHARLFGLPGTQVESTTLDAVVGIGFLRYFTVYGSGGIARHRAKLATHELQALENDELSLVLATPDTEAESSRTWMKPARAFGLRLAVLPPFVTLGAEVRDSGDRRSYAAKLAVGM